MSKEEPAWKADLRRAMYGRVSAHGVLMVLDLLAPHIQAAEQRGREAARREAAEGIRSFAWGKFQGFDDATAAIALAMADLIDPDKQ